MYAKWRTINLGAIKDQHPYLTTLFEHLGPLANSHQTLGVYETEKDLDFLKDFFPDVDIWIKGDTVPLDCLLADRNESVLECRFCT